MATKQNSKYALVTVSNRKYLVFLAKSLEKLGFVIVSSKRTTKFLKRFGINAIEVPKITGYEPIMGKQGIKLIHPKIFGAILADPNNKEHQRDLKKYKMHPFNLVVCNFYPFEKAISKNKINHEKAIYHLDIGGPAMVRCAAKNYGNTTIIVDPADYALVLKCFEELGYVPLQIRKSLSLKAFKYTARYDKIIINYLSEAFRKRADEKIIECRICLNSTKNPLIKIKHGLCDICRTYKKNFSKKILRKELRFVKSLVRKGKKYDAMVGISGGKDSTATLYAAKQMGFNPLAFTFDIGYYPPHIFSRAKKVANKLGVDYVRIPIMKYARKNDIKSYRLTANLFDKPESEETKKEFYFNYLNGKNHYSAECEHALPFVRICQLCRHTVIRAYYAEASKRKIPLIILGVNEWAGLSQSSSSKRYKVSGVRKLKPFANRPAVYVAHLPFLLQRNSRQTAETLEKIGWKKPRGENFVESNSNSCLLARAAESKIRRMLGFHPDALRLSREVLVGFIAKAQARKALDKIHSSKQTVRQVLERAEII